MGFFAIIPSSSAVSKIMFSTMRVLSLEAFAAFMPLNNA